MAGPHPKSPGWYPDPDILPGSRRFLRYWNGRRWTDRWRPTPILTTLNLSGPLGLPQPRVLEGPARTAELPAPAAEVSATREGPGGRSDTIDRQTGTDVRGVDLPPTAGPTGPEGHEHGSGRGIPPEPPDTGGGGGDSGSGSADDGSTSGRKIRMPRRRIWWVFAAIAVLCAVLVVLIGQALQPPAVGPRVLTDDHFVQAANALCASTMPTLRPADGGDFGNAVTPLQAATQIDKASAGLDTLATKLAALPIAPVDQPRITTWLAGWSRYDNMGRQYAAELRTEASTGKAPPVLKAAAAVAKTADDFARANGLNACLFEYAYSAPPSEF
jgi:hypothetical protein